MSDPFGFRQKSAEADRVIEFVVKTSKQCNLRCKYCYEFAELDKPDRMSRSQLAVMYEHIRDYITERDRTDGLVTKVQLVWHGGEPLLLDPEFYRETFRDQRRILAGVRVRNSVTTNLTRLDDARLRLLAEEFDAVSVSFDVYGGLRVNIAGRDSRQSVLENLRRLRDSGVDAKCITVLTSRNIARLEEIVAFYGDAGIPFRILPLFDGAMEGQTTPFALSREEEIGALVRLVDLWLENDLITAPPEPLNLYSIAAARAVADRPDRHYYSRRQLPRQVLVNTDGECYTNGEPYGDPDWSIGNIFTTSLLDIVAGDAFDRSVRESERRQALNCLQCPFFGHCDGVLVAEGDRQQRDKNEDGTMLCVARPVIEHLVHRMREASGVEAALG